MSYKIPLITSIISLSGISYYLYNKKKNRLIYHSNDSEYPKLVEYIYNNYSDDIKTVNYNDKLMYTFNEWRYRRRRATENRMKTITPVLCDINIVYKEENINIKINVLKDFWGDYVKLMEVKDCTSEEQFVRTLEMTSDNKEILFDFKDNAVKEMTKIY